MSTLKVDTLQTTGGAGLYPARVWVNFNGTGTVAIRASGHVSSITDNDTGVYTVNFTSALTDANFAACGGAGNGAGDPFRDTGFNQTNLTTSVKTTTFYGQSNVADALEVMIDVTR